jgi:hypothetical protein
MVAGAAGRQQPMGLSFFNFVSAPVLVARDLNRLVFVFGFFAEKQTTNPCRAFIHVSAN